MPLTIIVLGVAWLLSAHGVLPAISWTWTLGLALVGLLTFVYLGYNTVSFVMGGFLLIAAVFSVLRQTGRMTAETETPVLVIILGILMILARVLPVPRPAWLIEEENLKKSGE